MSYPYYIYKDNVVFCFLVTTLRTGRNSKYNLYAYLSSLISSSGSLFGNDSIAASLIPPPPPLHRHHGGDDPFHGGDPKERAESTRSSMATSSSASLAVLGRGEEYKAKTNESHVPTEIHRPITSKKYGRRKLTWRGARPLMVPAEFHDFRWTRQFSYVNDSWNV